MDKKLKLTKADIAARDMIAAGLRARYAELESVLDEFNSARLSAWSSIEAAQNAYNDELEFAREWLALRMEEIEDFVQGKSEKWAEGERAASVEAFKSEFESVDLEEIQIPQPDDLTLDEFADHADLLEQLPDSPAA